MDFTWTQEQNDLYQQMLLFARGLTSQDDKDNSWWTKEAWRRCGAQGLLGLSISEKYGGRGLGALMSAYLIEAFGRGCPDMGLAFSAAAHLLACAMPIAAHAEDAVRERLEPGLCSGDLVGANAITENDAGSDVFALKTRALRDGSTYVLSGEKSYVSNGPVADVFVLYALTNPAHGYLGITAFIVEKGTAGLTLSEPLNKMGLTSTPACRVTLDECRIPLQNRLGAEGQGAFIFKQSMQWERACLFAAYLGQMERQLEQTIAYAHERRQFGASIGKKQAVAHAIADMKLRLESARLLLYRSCWLLDRGEDATLAISLSKLAVSEAAIQSSLDAIHIHGSSGFNRETGVERMLRDAIPATLFSGTSEMQRDIIASLLGL